MNTKSKPKPSITLDQHIGNQLAKFQAKRGLTLRQMGEMTGMSFVFLCNLEQGKNSPNVRTLAKLSAGLDVSVQYWFRGFKGKAGG